MMNDEPMKKNQNPSAGRTNSTAKHLFLACGEATLRDAQVAFRELQHGEGRGTTETDYAKLERVWAVNEMYR